MIGTCPDEHIYMKNESAWSSQGLKKLDRFFLPLDFATYTKLIFWPIEYSNLCPKG